MQRLVFISYVWEHKAEVDRIQQALEAEGIRVWRDVKDLWPGEDWRTKIRQAIENDGLVFLACFSNNSIAKLQTYQRKELSLVVDQLRSRRSDRPWLISIRLSECEIPPFDLGDSRTVHSLHRVDLFGNRWEGGIRRLIAGIHRITDQWSQDRAATRVDLLGSDETAVTVAEFEQPIASFANLIQAGKLSEWNEEFVRNTIEQIYLWRQREEANPQIFELLVADIVKKLIKALTDPGPLCSELLRLGADEEVAAEISGRVAQTVGRMSELGDDDGVRDAELFSQIAQSTQRTATAVEALHISTDSGEKSLARQAGERVVLDGATAAGKEVAKVGLREIRNMLVDEWPKLQIGLMLAWTAVKELFTR